MSLLVACLVALATVFGLLAILAGAMRVITTLFPARLASLDSAVVAAISSAVAALVPGATVTRIEEER